MEATAADFPALPIIMVRRGSAIYRRLLKICGGGGVRPGQVIPLTDDEYESMREDMLAVSFEKEDR